MNKIHVQGKVIDDWADKLEMAYYDVNNVLCSERKNKTGRTASDLLEIDKDDLDIKIDTVLSVLKKVKTIKDFKP